jgi:hypothetical protein
MDIVQIISILLQSHLRNNLTRAGLFIKSTSISAETTEDYAGKKLYKQTISLDCRGEYRREYPIENIIEVIAMVDYHYFVIRQIESKLQERKAKTALDALIDNATGADKAIPLEAAELIRHSIREIIKYKKMLNDKFGQSHDLSHDEHSLVSISEFIKECSSDKVIEN